MTSLHPATGVATDNPSSPANGFPMNGEAGAVCKPNLKKATSIEF